MVYKQLKLQALLAGCYLFLATIGNLLAIPPGYASPIFPAAGFAAAIMLCFGHRAWLGILLGSFFLNLFLTQKLGSNLNTSIFISLFISLGVGLQAHIAKRLVEKVVKAQWRKMEGVSSIISTLLLAGPVACLVAASIGNLVLYSFGLIRLEELPYSWCNWWVGDSLGVLVFLPICLGVIYRKERIWKGRIKVAFMPIILAILMAASAFIGTSRLENEYVMKEVFEQGESFNHLLQQRFNAHQEAIASLRRLIEVTPEMTTEQFEYFTRMTLLDNTDISALSINAYLEAGQRNDFEMRMRKMLNNPSFQVTERNADGDLISAGSRQDYVAVQFISSLQTNAAALGYDINSESVRREAIRSAMLTGEPAVTAPIQLVQGLKDSLGLLVLHPAFSRYADFEEESKIFAFAVGVLNINEMVEAATAQTRNPELHYRILDKSSKSDVPVFQTSALPTLMGKEYMLKFDLNFVDRYWQIEVTPSQRYMQQMRSFMPLAVGVGSLLAVAMLQILVLTITGQNSVIRRKVEEQTRELRTKTKVISDRNAQLDAVFQCTPDGMIAFAENGTIKYANPALRNMLELKDERGMEESMLDAMLSDWQSPEGNFVGISSYFSEDGVKEKVHILNLNKPRKLCLQVLGIHTGAKNIPRILHFRDVTNELEVQKMKTDFLSHAAHELRTPMTTILGYTELLLARDYSKEIRYEMLQTVQRQTSLIVNMINDLLDIARIEANSQPHVHFVEFDLVSLLKEIVDELTFDLKRWPVKLKLQEHEHTMLGDRQKMRQAIMNVIVNAHKYSPSGGQITLKLETLPSHYLLIIEDSGIGMTADELRHVGEKFWRADISGNTPGTGLGVAIVREILSLHGGSLSFTSVFGRGTIATMNVPINMNIGISSNPLDV